MITKAVTDNAAALRPADRLSARHLHAVAAAVEESRRPATLKVYEGAWKRFASWAEREGVTSLPADPVTVAAYFVHRAESGLSSASLATGSQSDQLPSPHRRLLHSHGFGGREADPGGTQEPRRRTGEGGTPTGPWPQGGRPERHQRHSPSAQDRTLRTYGIPSGRSEARSGGRGHRVGHEGCAAAPGRSCRSALARCPLPPRWELPHHDRTLQDIKHVRCPLRGHPGHGRPEPDPPPQNTDRRQGIRPPLRKGHLQPNRRHDEGRRTWGRVLRTFATGRNGPGPHGCRGRTRRHHECRAVEVRTDARVLFEGTSGRTWSCR